MHRKVMHNRKKSKLLLCLPPLLQLIVSDSKVTGRGCSTKRARYPACETHSYGLSSEKFCYCPTDRCNSAPLPFSNMATLALALGLPCLARSNTAALMGCLLVLSHSVNIGQWLWHWLQGCSVVTRTVCSLPHWTAS